jgi:hypothetical protein
VTIKNIKLDPVELQQAFGLTDTLKFPLKLADATKALKSAAAAENITITPPLTQESTERTIRWNFKDIVVAHDDGDLEEVAEAIDMAVDSVPLAKQIFGGGIKGVSVVTTLARRLTKIVDIFEDGVGQQLVSAKKFGVVFERSDDDDGSTKFVGYRLSMASRYLNGETDEEDNSGFNWAQLLKIDDNFNAPGKKVTSGKETTDVYPSRLASAKVKLRKSSNAQTVSFDILSEARAADGLFMNLNSDVELRIFVAETQDDLDEAMAFNPDGVVGPQDGELVSADPAPIVSRSPVVPHAVVATNTSARRLVKRLNRGRITHLGVYLGALEPTKLAALAAGLGAEADTLRPSRELAGQIARALKIKED